MFNTTVYKKTMDCALELVLMFGADGIIVYSNRTADALLEYSNGLTGISITDVFPTAFVVENGALVWNIIQDDNMKSLSAYRGNRTCFDVEVRMLDFMKEEGLYVCIAQDSSKQNYLERKVNQADKQVESVEQIKTQFVANVTHELRTPVNGILGNTQDLLNRENDLDKQKKLRLIERGCNDMHAIINNILDFSKLESGKFDLEKREFNFRNMMEYIRSNHINKITEKGLQFFMTISNDIPEIVVGDELRIGQVLNNLLSNATKFTSAGKIAVEVVKTGQVQNKIELFFMVIDTGIGIEKNDHDKLFKSFSQVDASTTRKYGGTGLGLNISKQLVELMDGSIHVESERNKGTMFSFHIWLEIPGMELSGPESNSPGRYDIKIPSLSEFDDTEGIWQFGTPENKEELSKKMNKLILCVEMDNWEKAEMFMDTVKQLTADAPGPVKSSVLRLKMAVQKADYDKTIDAYDKVLEVL